VTAGNAVVELRQYTLKPGQRYVVIDIFEQHFIAAQEESGAQVIGHFRDLENPERFVWLRGFRDMPSPQASACPGMATTAETKTTAQEPTRIADGRTLVSGIW
jgi:hypothetical protein